MSNNNRIRISNNDNNNEITVSAGISGGEINVSSRPKKSANSYSGANNNSVGVTNNNVRYYEELAEKYASDAQRSASDCANYLSESQRTLADCEAVKTELEEDFSSGLTDHVEDVDNPHNVTAYQVNAYTKSETDILLSGKQPAGNYLTEHQPLDNYYTKAQCDNKYLTEHQDISGKANRSELSSVAITGRYSDLSGIPSLSEVATSGSYNDLTDKPTIPAEQVQSDWNVTDTTSKAYIKNKPTIPSGVIVDQTYDGTSTNAQSGVAIEGELTTNYQSKLVSGTDIKTINNTSLLGSGNISVQERFSFTYNTSTSLSNKTFTELKTAYESGKYIRGLIVEGQDISVVNLNFVDYNNYVLSGFRFSRLEDNLVYILRVDDNNTWTFSITQLELASKKVTSISSSSTNTQYPSAKCVYDELTDKADTDLSNVPTTKGILTESYVNGTSGYRIYADNYCVQWGRFAGKSGTITLLKSYADTNYCVAYSSSARISWYCTPSTVNTMSVASDSSSSYVCYWITTGFTGGQ